MRADPIGLALSVAVALLAAVGPGDFGLRLEHYDLRTWCWLAAIVAGSIVLLWRLTLPGEMLWPVRRWLRARFR